MIGYVNAAGHALPYHREFFIVLAEKTRTKLNRAFQSEIIRIWIRLPL